ncbi:Gfo/Idh/MocA family protein [Helicobacter anatolicus]|uniref:Gfo/Idh/MocA family protein n=1 Tax=Helicobacter anatolicus TaxID=2905874 RepID=UPI001E447EE1|nr:Gfo/Idh/MocA family oxidoreductase [Helicobacter anatolicus]
MQVAVIGYGYWGRNIAKAIVDSDFFCLRTIFDCDFKQVLEAQKLYDFVIYQSYDDILQDDRIEAVFIVTPPHTHFDLSKKALEFSKHVFVEKPLCTNSLHAQKLYHLAQEKKCALHCDHIFLYAPPVIWLKQNMDILGNIVYINARRINLGLFQNSVDVIWDLAIHDLSIIDYLIGLEIKNVEVFARKYQDYPNNALANINLELQNGVIVTISVSWLSPIKIREMIIGGEKKSVIYDETKKDKIILFDSGVVVRDYFSPANLYQKMVEYKTGAISNPALQGKMALNQSLDAFAFKIKNLTHVQNILDQKHVMRIIEVLEKISTSKI